MSSKDAKKSARQNVASLAFFRVRACVRVCVCVCAVFLRISKESTRATQVLQFEGDQVPVWILEPTKGKGMCGNNLWKKKKTPRWGEPKGKQCFASLLHGDKSPDSLLGITMYSVRWALIRLTWWSVPVRNIGVTPKPTAMNWTRPTTPQKLTCLVSRPTVCICTCDVRFPSCILLAFLSLLPPYGCRLSVLPGKKKTKKGHWLFVFHKIFSCKNVHARQLLRCLVKSCQKFYSLQDFLFD